jgi:hypothetical protein
MLNKAESLIVEEKSSSYKVLKAGITFVQGELILDLSSAVEVPDPDYISIDLGNCHVHHPVGRYLNHSCEPNAYIDKKKKQVVAEKTIEPGDEITFNYLVNERQIVAPFDCRCASPNCVGRVEK